LIVFPFTVQQTRQSDRQQWACPRGRVIDDAVHDVLSQNVNAETTLVDGLLAALQKTGTS